MKHGGLMHSAVKMDKVKLQRQKLGAMNRHTEKKYCAQTEGLFPPKGIKISRNQVGTFMLSYISIHTLAARLKDARFRI